jgi:hypothetical protein
MKVWAKAGLIGFITVFVGLWIILFLIGHDTNGWKCLGLSGADYCEFIGFISSFAHWAFVLFFSWVGFFGGIIDAKIINKILKKNINEKTVPLKVTFVIMVSLIVVFAIIGFLAFDQWAEIMVYAIVFFFFTLFISWAIGKIKYRK